MQLPRSRRSSPSRIAPLFFFLGGCFFLMLALGVIGAFVFLRGSDSSDAFTWKPPLDLVDDHALAPGTVLLPLTDVNSADALNAMLDQAHLENAYALIAYDLDLPDATRIGALLQLGAHYATAKDISKASACYQAAALVATLSPSLADALRLDTYQQASTGLRNIGANDAARFITDQAYIVAQYTTAISRDVRVRRLNQIADAYTALGANSLAGQARNKVVDLMAATGEEPPGPVRPIFSPTLAKLPASPQVDAAKQQRIAAAKQLSGDIQDLKIDSNFPADSQAQLSDALLAEDDQRQAYYNNQLAQAKDPALQAALWNDKVHWLTLKYRVARGAFGKDLVPEWSKDKATIADDWYQAWDDLIRFYEAQAGAVAKPQDPVLATEFVLRQEVFIVRWGWSNMPEQDVRANLDNLNQQLMKSPFLSLHLDVLTRNGKTNYWLVPDDLYGEGEKALPK